MSDSLKTSMQSDETTYENNTKKTSKYDNTYKGDIEATNFGIILLIWNIILYSNEPFRNVVLPDYVEWFLIIAPIVLRVIIAFFWIRNIAKRQNRNQLFWCCIGFISPTITLIIIGQLKKLYWESEVDSVLVLMTKSTMSLANRNIKYILLNEKNKFDLIWGKYTKFDVAFSVSRRGHIYKDRKSGKYFYMDYSDGRKYFSTIETAIEEFYRYINVNNL